MIFVVRIGATIDAHKLRLDRKACIDLLATQARPAASGIDAFDRLPDPEHHSLVPRTGCVARESNPVFPAYEASVVIHSTRPPNGAEALASAAPTYVRPGAIR